ncbi:hypothetical protein [Brevibacillus invocatus]|uniref:hypothetical protein n=1 Tax=Brevibacillus invocatus TaxID=173959 RepID=UPI00203B2BF3|nr:hypothetical protein [Brevibacillus invocatus]MCM3079622.1 hypothetical protein [Brevibacillus invocatus]MCM3429820.1 hypothetical protein [Brevibacillus invocatus]
MKKKILATLLSSGIALSAISVALAAPMGIVNTEASMSKVTSTAGGEKHFVISSKGVTKDISSRVKASDVDEVVLVATIYRNAKKLNTKTMIDSQVKTLTAKLNDQEEYGTGDWEVGARGEFFYSDGTSESRFHSVDAYYVVN